MINHLSGWSVKAFLRFSTMTSQGNKDQSGNKSLFQIDLVLCTRRYPLCHCSNFKGSSSTGSLCKAWCVNGSKSLMNECEHAYKKAKSWIYGSTRNTIHKTTIDLMANEAQRSGKCCLYLSSQRKYAADKICIRNFFDRVLYKKNFHVRFQSFSKRPMRNGHRFAIIKETHWCGYVMYW